MRKSIARSLCFALVLMLMSACGGEGEQGPPGPEGEPGDDAQVETQRVEDHDDCPGGGTEILIDGEAEAVVCDGETGEDGTTPEVETERHDDHDECPAGGVDILVDGDVETTVCDGEEGHAPGVEIESDDDHEECPAGGIDIIIDGEVEAVVCDGEDGETPTVETERSDDHQECPAGGVDIMIDGEVEDVVCDGESPTVETERNDDHEECYAGGVDILVDGEVEAVVCDGQDGDGAEIPEISSDRFDSHENCETGGTLLTFSYDGADDQSVVICDADDELDLPNIITERVDDHEECAAGGTTITFSYDDTDDIVTHVCDGEDGDDGEDGQDSDITIEDLDDTDVDHECGFVGGYLVTVAEGDKEPASFIVCRPYEPFETCETVAPESPYERDIDDERTEFAAEFEIPGVTDDDDESLPDDFVADVGISDVEDDAQPNDPDLWYWWESEIDEEYDDADGERVVAELGESELEEGKYYYLFRFRLEDDGPWVTCGLQGVVEMETYNSDTDAGFLDVVIPLETFLHWDFEAEEEEDRLLDPPLGDGWARFSDGDQSDPVGTSTFFGSGDSHWVGQGEWLESDTFPADESVYDDYEDVDGFDDLEFFEFNAGGFSDYEVLRGEIVVRRSTEGPTQVQMVGEFSDGSLGMLEEALEIPDEPDWYYHSFDLSSDRLVPIEDGAVADGSIDDDAHLESVRVYGFNAVNFGGSENVRIIDIEFEGW